MQERPIGYWIRQADRTITDAGFAPLVERGLARAHWQVLNLICDESPTMDSLAEKLQPFGESGAILSVARHLAAKGWANFDGAAFSATPAGVTARNELAKLVDTIRRRTMVNITQDDLATTIRTLKQLIANLDPTRVAV